jgi:phospholipid transport system substrate-binding protein
LRRRALLVCLLGLLAAKPVQADPFHMPIDPATTIAQFDAALVSVMKAGRAAPFIQRFNLLAPAVDRTFDLSAILRTSVGFAWAEIPAPIRAQLLAVFRQFTIASYVANFDSYDGQQIRVLPNSRSVGAERVVATEIVPRTGKPTRLDYVMRDLGSGWRVVDVLLDGTISRVAVQRSDFSALVASRGGGGLIQSLRQKVGQLSGGALG